MNTAVRLEVFSNVLSGIAEEMGVRLQRSAYSSNIKERRDFSCALFNREGEMLAQAAHIPVHLGSMPQLVKKIVNEFDLKPGDMIVSNDPFSGGTHLPDITLLEPIFCGEALWGYGASRAHHSDVGGMEPGSMPKSREIFQEGIIIPPLFLKKGGVANEDLLSLITANTRIPQERTGDILAQEAALTAAGERVRKMVEVYGFDESLKLASDLLDYSERLTLQALETLGRGTGAAVDYLEDDEKGRDIPIKAMVNLTGDGALVDFTGTAQCRHLNINAPLPVTMAAVYYVFRCVLGDHIPANGGCFRPISVNAPEGTIVNAGPPFAVAAGNVETSQRVVDVLFKALSLLLPARIPAASQGTMNNVAIGGYRGPGRGNFAYYETIGGGMGGGPRFPGRSALHTHMTNTSNTPVEALENLFPFMITRYCIRKGSGGKGRNPGGDGIVREYLFKGPCRVSVISERRRLHPYGLAEGDPGMSGRNTFFCSATGQSDDMPGRFTIDAGEADRLVIETPGGGGWGDA